MKKDELNFEELVTKRDILLTVENCNNIYNAFPVIFAFGNFICIGMTLLLIFKNLLQLHGNAIEMGMPIGESYTGAFGIQVRDLILPVGTTIRVGLGAFIPEGTALVINPSVCAPVEQPVPGKGNFFLEELAKTGAGTKYQIFGQIGLDHGPEWFHGKITGLSTDFTAPVGQKVVSVTSA